MNKERMTIVAEVGFYQVLLALDYFVDHRELDRLSTVDAQRIAAAAGRMQGRIDYRNQLEKETKCTPAL